ncbi:2OG-Fe(II) oxygenase [Aquicoccus sp. SCR17]|nr:2OG-Fe(II) oxygenase [Carideicomes alvinocaridis]
MLAPYCLPSAFTAAECARIAALHDENPGRDGGLAGLGRDHNLRRAELVWLDEVEETGWIMTRLIDITREANRARFGFDLSDFAESPQLARYGAERAGHFHWHADIGDTALAARRKLTLVVQLSGPDEYDGGTLEIMPSARVQEAPRGQGDAVLFPAFLLHRVTPVTRGARLSLTVWAHGPAFR